MFRQHSVIEIDLTVDLIAPARAVGVFEIGHIAIGARS